MKTKYRLPVESRFIIRLSRTESVAHRFYPNSVDFLVPVGTPVHAAAAGTVIDFVDRHNRRGSHRRFERFENFIEIRHANDDYSYYGHLRKNGAVVKVGQRVRAGQIIGYSWDTGWMANIPEPHLHFMVGRYDYRTIRFRFEKSP